tara:strand:+ start:372 stop:776 length:405 start_codon:yes stop_codon:yes gene_type:complete
MAAPVHQQHQQQPQHHMQQQVPQNYQNRGMFIEGVDPEDQIRCFLGNISTQASEEDVAGFLAQHGYPNLPISLITDKQTQERKGRWAGSLNSSLPLPLSLSFFIINSLVLFFSNRMLFCLLSLQDRCGERDCCN